MYLSGWAWWFKWVQWLSARCTEYYRPTHQGLEKHWHSFSYRRSFLCKWIHLTMGPIHITGGAHCINCPIYGCKVCTKCSLFVSIYLHLKLDFFYYLMILVNISCIWSRSGNHERDWPNSGSFYENMDSGGECGVLAETVFYFPAENRAKFW